MTDTAKSNTAQRILLNRISELALGGYNGRKLTQKIRDHGLNAPNNFAVSNEWALT
jgi:hypothetical protein